MTQRTQRPRPDAMDAGFVQAVPVDPLDISAVFRVIWHGKFTILLVILVSLALAGYYAFRVATPRYAASASLQLDTSTNPLSGVVQQTAITTVNDLALNTTVALVTSDIVLSNAITAQGLESDPEFNRYLQPSPPFSLSALRTRARNFLAGTSEQSPDDAAVHEKTIQNLRGALTVKRQPDTYILQVTAHSGDPTKARQIANAVAFAFLTHSETLQRQSAKDAEDWLQTRVNGLHSQLQLQERQITNLIASAQIQDGDALDSLSTQVLDVEQTLSESRAILANLQNAPDRGSARNIAEITQLENEIQDINNLKERLVGQLSSQSIGLAQLQQIQLEAAATRELYRSFLAKLQENRVQQGLDAPIAHQMAPANQARYIGPRKLLILAIAGLLGGTIGVVLVGLVHANRKGVSDAHVLHAKTGLPVLAQLSSRAMRRSRKANRSRSLSSHTALSRATYELWTALSLAPAANAPQVVLATSSIPQEGKSSLALALTQMLAKAGKSVVLIGGDENSTARRLALDPETVAQSVANWAREAPSIHDASLGADIVMLPTLPQHRGVFVTEQLRELIPTLRMSFDHIIIDGPPVLQSVEAQMFATQADAIIYAVRWSTTPLAVVRRGLDMLADIGHPAFGLVLTKINKRKMRKLSADPYINLMQPNYLGDAN